MTDPAENTGSAGERDPVLEVCTHLEQVGPLLTRRRRMVVIARARPGSLGHQEDRAPAQSKAPRRNHE